MRLLKLLRKLPRLGSLSPEELRELVAAQMAILGAHRLVRSRPLGELVAVANETSAGAVPAAGPFSAVDDGGDAGDGGNPGGAGDGGSPSGAGDADGAHAPVHERPGGEAHPDPDTATADRVAWAVLAASNYGLTRPTCLVRSLAIQSLLRKRGLTPGEIKIGVRWTDERFEAHAWVEHDTRVLGDTRRHVRAFEPVTDMTMVQF